MRSSSSSSRPIPSSCSPCRLHRRLLWIPVLLALLASPVAGFEIVVHTATAQNTFLHVTQLDHPQLNDDPTAEFLVSQVFNPLVMPSVANPSEIGISYGTSSGRWSIENQDLAAMPIGARFFVLIPEFGFTAVHTTTEANTDGSVTVIDNPLLNGRGDGHLGFTFVRNPGGGSGARNDHPVGANYREDLGRWTFINQDFADMTIGSAFFIEGIFDFTKASVTPGMIRIGSHVTSASNTSADRTFIDRPDLNGSPYSFVMAFPLVSGAFNAHPIATFYDFAEQKWGIMNADEANLPLNMEFSLLYVGGAVFVDGFESGGLDGWSSSSRASGVSGASEASSEGRPGFGSAGNGFVVSEDR